MDWTLSQNRLSRSSSRVLRILEIPPLEEIRYATKYNFTGTKLYPVPDRVFAEGRGGGAGENATLSGRQGLGLKVWDGFRPMSVQQKMWDLIQDERYVSNPAKNSGRHTRGTAVDVTLIDKRGGQLALPTDYDDFTEKAHSDWAGASSLEKQNRDLLHRAADAGLAGEVRVLTNFGPFEAQINGDYIGQRYVTYTNDLHVNPTFQMGLEASYTFEVPEGYFVHRLKLSGNMTNVGNTKGVETPVVTTAAGGYAEYPIAPRMWFVTLSAKL